MFLGAPRSLSFVVFWQTTSKDRQPPGCFSTAVNPHLRAVKGFQTRLHFSDRNLFKEQLGFVPVLKPQHSVIRVADDDYIARCLLPPPLVHPEVENVMQV